MKRLLLAFFASSLATTCPAQTTVTPPGYDTRQGLSYSMFFGDFSSGRMQFVESYLKGKGAKVLKKVGYRRYKAVARLDGRSWTRVTLDCADGKVTSFDSTFSRNALSTPVRVFSAAVTWPTMTTPSTTKFLPALSFPFSKVWPYSGSKDVLLDYEFTGGSFANGAAWVTTLSFRMRPFLDSPPSVYSETEPNHLPYGLLLGCRDSGHPEHTSALCYPRATVYPAIGGPPETMGKMRFAIQSRYTARTAPVVQAVDIVGSERGTWIPSIGCNPVHIGASSSMLLFFRKASSTGNAYTDFGYLPYKSFFKGQTVWTQAIWDDSKTGRAQLTKAGRMTIPAQPTPPLPRACNYLEGATGPRGKVDWSHLGNPVIQWTH